VEKIRGRIKQIKCQILAMNELLLDRLEIHKKTNAWILGIVYRIVLDVFYVLVVRVYWAGDGFVLNPSLLHWIFSWLFYLVGYWLILQVDDFVISFFLHVQWILTISPVLVLGGTQKGHSIFYQGLILIVLLIQVMLAKSKKKLMPISICQGKLGRYVDYAIVILAPLVWIIMAHYNDFAGLKAFDFAYIYEMRAKLVYPPAFGYIVRWVISGGIPWLFMKGLAQKRVFYVLYSVILQVFFYMLIGMKGPLFLMVILLGVFVLSKMRLQFWGAYAGLIFAGLFGTIFGVLPQTGRSKLMITFNAMLGERTLFCPALIKHWFYDFFAEMPKVYFADGMIGKFLSQTYLYNDSTGTVVYAYVNNDGLNVEANTGYLADSYAQAGILGMLIMGIVVILLVRFISNYQKCISREILYSIVAIFAVILNDGALFTSLLSGGFFLMIVFLITNSKMDEKE